MALKDLIETTKRQIIERAQQYYDETDKTIAEIFDEPDLIQSRFEDPALRRKFSEYADLYRNLNNLESIIIPNNVIDDTELVNQINQFLNYNSKTESEESKKLHRVLSTYIDLYNQEAAEEWQTMREHKIREETDQILHRKETPEELAEREELRWVDEIKPEENE